MWNNNHIEYLKNLVLEHGSTKANSIFREDNQEFSRYQVYRMIQKIINTPSNTEQPIEIGTMDGPVAMRDIPPEIIFSEEPEVEVVTTTPRPAGQSALCLLLSDLHFGKRTDRFNLVKARERLLSIADSQIESSGINMNEISSINLLLCGDLVEGEDIYPSQSHHLDATAIQQVAACSQAIFSLVGKLKSKYPDKRIEIYSAPGNHGRTSKTAAEETNWDNVVSTMLGQMFKEDAKVTVHENIEEFYLAEINGCKVLMYHHGVKHTSTSATKIKLAGWKHMFGFNILVHGHWHEYELGNYMGTPIMKNGSLCGPDDLSQRMGVFDQAKQGFFVIKPDGRISTFGFFEWP